jgi:hypothetical protein
MRVSSIAAINKLPEDEKRKLYMRLVPGGLLHQFDLRDDLRGPKGENLYVIKGEEGSSHVELGLYHQPDFPDPLVYGHLCDTANGQIHVLLYVMNDPNSPRFNTDILPDGRATKFGIEARNLEAEHFAMQAGLSPGQVRKGLRKLEPARDGFESFIRMLGHDRYFIEPLFYHNAIIFERYGFRYERGRKLMERIHAGFQPGGALRAKLDASSPFRSPRAADSLRLRSWAIQDGVLGEPFSKVTMYREIGKQPSEDSAPGVAW